MMHILFQGVLFLLILVMPFRHSIDRSSDDEQYERKEQNIAAELKPNNISFCDVVNQPDRNNQKIIRTRAILVQSLSASVDGGELYLYSQSCNQSDKYVLVEFDQAYNANKQTQSTLERYVSQNNNRGVGRSEIVFIGRFDNAKKSGFGHLDAWRYRFVIVDIENVKSVSKGVPWPKQIQ